MSDSAADSKLEGLSTLFYRRPRLLVLAVALVVVSGLVAYQQLPRSEDPELLGRFALITTYQPGVSAKQIENRITDVIEEELQDFEEIRKIDSSSRVGVSVITVELQETVFDIGPVWSRVRDQLEDARSKLPKEATDPDLDEQTIVAWTQVAALTWTGDGPANPALLQRLAGRLEDRLRSVPGTEDTDLFGEPAEEVVVEVDPARMASLGLTPAEVAAIIQRSDTRVTAGVTRGTESRLLLEVSGQIDSLERLRSIPIVQGEGDQTLTLEQIATIDKAVATPPDELALIAGERSVVVASRMQSSERVDLWSRKAREVLADFRDQLPPGIELVHLFDQSDYTEARLDGLLGNLALGALFVLIVLFFTMGWRSALVVGSALPLSALAVFEGLQMLEIPIHQMSITGLIIALGLLIDNAIVMVDEVQHGLSEGKRVLAAIGESVRRLFVPLLGSTLTTVLAFMPIILLPGGAGEFVGAIGVSVCLAIVSSFLFAMTIIPALVGWLHRLTSKIDTQGPHRWWRDGFYSEKLARGYGSGLKFVFERPWLGVAFGLLLPVVGYGAALTLQEQFFPPADRDMFQIELRLPHHASIERTETVAQGARRLLMDEEMVEEVHWFVGANAPKVYYNMIQGTSEGPGYAQAVVQLERSEGSYELMNRLQDELDEAFPGAQMVVRSFEQGPPFKAPVELKILGPDAERLRQLGDDLRRIMTTVPEITHTRTTLSSGSPQLRLALDEEEARRMGLDPVGVAQQLAGYLEGAQQGLLTDGSENIPIRVRLAQDDRGDLERLSDLELQSPALAGGPESWTPLSGVSSLDVRPELGRIDRLNGERVNLVHGFTETGTLPADALQSVREAMEAEGFELPSGYRLEVGGESAERDRAVSDLMGSALVLLIMLAATLILSFQSFRMAGIIASVAVLAVGLSMLALFVFDYPLGFMAIVGSMGLVGVAINDTIVVLSALRHREGACEGDAGAMADTVVRASRHVFSTTLTTMAGFTPLLIAGGRFWPPLAVAIAGGVAGATILALVFAPSAYRLLMCRGCSAEGDSGEMEEAQEEVAAGLVPA